MVLRESVLSTCDKLVLVTGEILPLIVQEVEAEPQPLQELFKVLQQEPKARGHRGTTSQRIHKNERREEIYLENITIKHRHQKDRRGEQERIRLLDCGSSNIIIDMERPANETLSLIVKEIEAKPQPLQEPLEFLQQEEEPKEQEQRGITCHQIHMNTRGHNGELVVDGKHYVDNLGISHLSHQKHKAKQDVLLNNQQLRVHSAVPDEHGREDKKETTDPEVALEVPILPDTGSASAPQHHDTQKNSEQVLQRGTEAITEVSLFDNSKQLANSNTLHGKPGLWPAEPSLPIPTTHDGNNKSEAKEEDLTSHRNQSTKTTGCA